MVDRFRGFGVYGEFTKKEIAKITKQIAEIGFPLGFLVISTACSSSDIPVSVEADRRGNSGVPIPTSITDTGGTPTPTLDGGGFEEIATQLGLEFMKEGPRDFDLLPVGGPSLPLVFKEGNIVGGFSVGDKDYAVVFYNGRYFVVEAEGKTVSSFPPHLLSLPGSAPEEGYLSLKQAEGGEWQVVFAVPQYDPQTGAFTGFEEIPVEDPEVIASLLEKGYYDPFAEALEETVGLKLRPVTLDDLRSIPLSELGRPIDPDKPGEVKAGESGEPAEAGENKTVYDWLLERTNPMSPDAKELYQAYLEGFTIDTTKPRNLNAEPSLEERMRGLEGLNYYVDEEGRLYIFDENAITGISNNLTKRRVLAEIISKIENKGVVVVNPSFVFFLPFNSEGLAGVWVGDLFTGKGVHVLEQDVGPIFSERGFLDVSVLPHNVPVELLKEFLGDPIFFVYGEETKGKEVTVGIPLREDKGLGGVLFPGRHYTPKGEVLDWSWPTMPLKQFEIPVYVTPDGKEFSNPALSNPQVREQTLVALIWPREEVIDPATGQPAWVDTIGKLTAMAEGKDQKDINSEAFVAKNPATGEPSNIMISVNDPDYKTAVERVEEALAVVSANEGFGWLSSQTAQFEGGSDRRLTIFIPGKPNKGLAVGQNTVPFILDTRGKPILTVLAVYDSNFVDNLRVESYKGDLFYTIVHEAFYEGPDRDFVIVEGIEYEIIRLLTSGHPEFAKYALSAAEGQIQAYSDEKLLKSLSIPLYNGIPPEDSLRRFFSYVVEGLENRVWEKASELQEKGKEGIVPGAQVVEEEEVVYPPIPVGHVIWVNGRPFVVNPEPVRISVST